MISLKTLPQATAQEVYNYIKTHLLTQNKRSIGEDDYCQYKSNDGLSCAAGCLISDEEYNKEKFEYSNWAFLVACNSVPESHCSLITSLQNIHDHANIEDWSTELNKVALKYNLIP